MDKLGLIVICGPTASGKTSLAVSIAKRYNGEIVSADSMQIYKDMQIATAKPIASEMDGVKHHLIDFLDVGESFSVADYVNLAHECIKDISLRGKQPILCGGTGLYISSLVDNVGFDDTCADTEIRAELSDIAREKGGEYLLEILRSFDPEAASKLHPNNLTRIIRAIEVYKVSGRTMTEALAASKRESPYDLCMIGINYADREKLYQRINDRVDSMISSGLIEEAKSVLEMSDLKTSFQAIGYKELKPYFDNVESLETCVENLKRETRRYAKRQLTWFRRDERINWIYPDLLSGNDEVISTAFRIIDNSDIVRRP